MCFVYGSFYSNYEYLLLDLYGFLVVERVVSSGVDVLFCGYIYVFYVCIFDVS